MSKVDFKNLSEKTQVQKRIESPLAKYNSLGQLTCIVCNQIIKSELIWNAHLNSKQHLENKQKLKSKLSGAGTAPVSASHPSNAASTQSQDKVTSTSTHDSTGVFKRPMTTSQNTEPNESNNKKQKLDNLIKKTDLIDLNKKASTVASTKEIIKIDKVATAEASNHTTEMTSTATSSTIAAIPEGFFDDPDLDDKMRGVSREANLDAEYEAFKKIIQAEERESEIIIDKDDVLRDVERDLVEVDELIDRWNKIENLHQRREAILAAQKLKKSAQMEQEVNDDEGTEGDESDEEGIDMENVLGLAIRSKNRC